MPLDLHYGNAVTGDQRFERPELQSRLMRTLNANAGVKMFGLRRIGKSTLRLYAVECLREAKIPFIFFDCQGHESLGQFLSSIHYEMPAEKSFIGRAFKIVNTLPEPVVETVLKKGGADHQAVSAYWRVMSDAIKKTIETSAERPVLVIDEFPYLIKNMIKRDPRNGPREADQLLASMREWRNAGMKMLLTGSIGLTSQIRKYDLTSAHLGDLRSFQPPELSEREARDFILAASQFQPTGRWAERHTEALLKELSSFYPCFLVRGLQEVDINNPAEPEEFEHIFSKRVRPELHTDFFAQFNDRFRDYAELPRHQQEKLIKPALKTIFEASAPCAVSTLPCKAAFSRIDLDIALSMLNEDGFIDFTEDRDGERLWRPASRLARLWWKRSGLA